MSPKKGKQIVADLRRRSEKALWLAKETLRAERIEPRKLRNALEHYIRQWDDFTHVGFFSMACEAVGGNPDDNLPPQEGIALMSAAFDIHDDIIDKSTAKNKIPTVYGMYGVEIALLLGNAFLIQGLKLLADSTAAFPREKGKTVLEATKKLLFEVGNAHALEIISKRKNQVTPENYFMITNMKAASIEADLMLGALFGGGNEIEVASLARLGRILGILATLRDDLIDVFDIEELRQRIITNDLPVPIAFAMRNKEAKTKIEDIISRPKMTQNTVDELVKITLNSCSFKEMKKRMQLLIEEATPLFPKLPKNNSTSELQAVVSFMIEDL